MSVINQMLQDLDKRNSDGAVTHNVHEQVKVVAIQKSSSSLRLIGFGLFLLLAGGAGFLWAKKFLPKVSQTQVSQPTLVPTQVAATAPVAAPVDVPVDVPVEVPAPLVAPVAASPLAPVAVAPAPAAPIQAPVKILPTTPVRANEVSKDLVLKIASDLKMTQSALMRSLEIESSAPSLSRGSKVQGSQKIPEESHQSGAKQEKNERTTSFSANEDRSLLKSAAVESMNTSQVGDGASKEVGINKASEATGSANLEKKIKELTPQQRAENDYRKATALIAQNKSAEALPMLEQSLKIDPTNASARQTLVRLMLESKRQDDAIKLLQNGLNADQTHTGMAMILARLQVENADFRTAIATLHRSLPYAADNADYHAFLAALLQRQAQHKEAIEHYTVAVRKTPQNGVWWMGLGISLQAENRSSDAQDAFTKARASNSLSPELLAFVDQKLGR